MKKIIISLLLIFLLASVFMCTYVDAAVSIPSGIKNGMKQANSGTGMGDTQTAKVINNVIGLIQVAGSGIALVVITIMGIKYILAAPSEKADVKKMVMPVIIGCVLLFGAVNIAGMIEKFANTELPNS